MVFGICAVSYCTVFMCEIENHALSVIQHIIAFFSDKLFTFQMLKAGNNIVLIFPKRVMKDIHYIFLKNIGF
jgi:hypothetical protein